VCDPLTPHHTQEPVPSMATAMASGDTPPPLVLPYPTDDVVLVVDGTLPSDPANSTFTPIPVSLSGPVSGEDHMEKKVEEEETEEEEEESDADAAAVTSDIKIDMSIEK
jgi:hypothetical protein